MLPPPTLSLFTLAVHGLRLLSLVGLVSGFALTVCAQEKEIPAEFKPMFNGNDLTGWVRTNTPAETWAYRDGVLHCTGKPIGELRTDKMFQNFIMELEWRHLVPGGNAGIFVWADDVPARGVPFHRGIEVQVLENSYGNTKGYTTHGDIFPIHGAKMTPINGRGGDRAFPSELLSKPSPEWNHYRIECRDGNVALSVNGKLVTRGTNAWPKKGYICLESEGGKVEYRNVRIAELPANEIPADQIAIADRGYQSIYSGLDLRGWIAIPSLDSWKANDWVLLHQGGDQPSVLTYVSQTPIKRFLIDVKLPDVQAGLSCLSTPKVCTNRCTGDGCTSCDTWAMDSHRRCLRSGSSRLGNQSQWECPLRFH